MRCIRFFRERAVCALLAGPLSLASAHSCAQTLKLPPPKPDTGAPDKTQTLSLAAKLVNLPVVVRDKKGALVQNLSKDDFVLSVDGKPQVIRYFDKDSNLPLTLGLLVDVSQSQRSVLDQERTASSAFLDNMLKSPSGQAPDRAFVIQFARETELLQDLTNSTPKLQAALKELDTPSPNSNSSSGSDSNDSGDSSGGSVRRHGGTELYDALYLSGTELMSKQTGRKAVVILSDGVDNGSRKSLAGSIEAAQRANEIVYSIYFKGEEPHQDNPNRGGYPGGGRRGGGGYPAGGGGYPGGGGGGYPGGGGGSGGGGGENRVDGKKILERISGETGGRMFEVTKKQDLPSIYNQISEELRSQYRLGYTPDEATASDGYHQVDLTLPKQNKLLVQTRDGYYTGK